MEKVLYRSSMSAVLVYIIVGVFGYLTFSSSLEQTQQQLWSPDKSKDILEADYGDDVTSIKVS